MNGHDLVFEIGTEELPSSAIYGALAQLQVRVPKALDDARLGYDAVAVVASPRRIAVLVSGLAEQQTDAVNSIKGPAAKAAYDAEGNPTPAAIGFARGKGVDVASLTVVEDDAGAYVYATIEQTGADALEVLPGLCQRLAENIEWPKSQRWGSGEARFSRPVRWLMCLYGTDVVPVEFAGLTAGRTTYGHRFLAPEPIEVFAAFEYPSRLEQAFVAVDHEIRAGMVREGIASAEASSGDKAVVPDKTFAEVVNLVEWPTVAVGTFDEEFLEVPREVLENAMGSHQRYFPLERADGSLDNRFLVAHNGDAARTPQIIEGHERVIRARLADAAFFYREDLAHRLEDYLPRLDAIVFQEKLGTLGDKVGRVERLAGRIAELIGASADDAASAKRAARLSKADLVTNVVVEFTDLQGTMGRYYALASGETAEVAAAIEEHYRPRGAGDELPASVAGRIVAMADKLDTVCGIFAAGMAPTGSADPYALRRAANGVLQMALAGTRVSLDALIASALDGYEGVLPFDAAAVAASVREFVLTRLDTILKDRGHAYDTVEAVLATAADDPADALARAEALTQFRSASDAMEDLSVAYTRAKNLAKPELGTETDSSLMGDEERVLADALASAESVASDLLDAAAYSALLETFAGLRGPIDAFFDNVMVMVDDEGIRDNRLRLLNRFVALFGRFGDFSRLSG